MPAEDVKAMLSARLGEFLCLTFPSHPSGETEPFFDHLLPRIVSTSEDEFTFYAHAKGVTRPEDPCIRKWTEWMYFYNLRDVEALLPRLADRSCSGCFRQKGRFPQFAEAKLPTMRTIPDGGP